MLDMLRNAILPLNMRVGAVSAAHLPELRAEYDALHSDGLIGDTIHHIMVDLSQCGEGSGIDAGQMILIVASYTPITTLLFCTGGKKHMVQIPPTYTDYVKLPPKIERILNETLAPRGYAVKSWEKLPMKLLAVRSGLAEYGRNNIAYVEGMGSFVFLSAYLTGMPCKDGWREARRMAHCDNCMRCLRNCPTGTIDEDRRVIDAERCLTWHNEQDSSKPFPEWLDISAHNSIVGCMRCQSVCPQNRDAMNRPAGPVEFDEEETALLLGGSPKDTLPEALKEKLDQTSMDTFYQTISRNLKALLE